MKAVGVIDVVLQLLTNFEKHEQKRKKVSAATKTNPFNISSGIICSCGKMCKDSRGLKIHQAKTKCQMPKKTH